MVIILLITFLVFTNTSNEPTISDASLNPELNVDEIITKNENQVNDIHKPTLEKTIDTKVETVSLKDVEVIAVDEKLVVVSNDLKAKCDFNADKLTAESYEPKEIHTLECWNVTNEDYDFIKQFKWVKKLEIGGSDINLAFLEGFNDIEILSLKTVKEMDFSYIKLLPNLKELELEEGRVINETAIGVLFQLEKLKVFRVGLEDWGFLSDQYSIVELEITNSKLNEIPKLGSDYSLKKLKLIHVGLVNVESFEKYYNLEYLDVSNNSIKSLENLDLENGTYKSIIARNNPIDCLPEIKKVKIVKITCNSLVKPD